MVENEKLNNLCFIIIYLNINCLIIVFMNDLSFRTRNEEESHFYGISRHSCFAPSK